MYLSTTNVSVVEAVLSFFITETRTERRSSSCFSMVLKTATSIKKEGSEMFVRKIW